MADLLGQRARGDRRRSRSSAPDRGRDRASPIPRVDRGLALFSRLQASRGRADAAGPAGGGRRAALRSAERLVYLENQFLRAPEIVEVLVDKLRNPPTDEFRLLTVLPGKPKSGAEDTRGQIGVLDADGGAGRFLACTLHQRGEDARPVYVHAKIGIVDDRWLTIGSANLNEHSLFNDTEMKVVVQDPALVRETRLRLWAEHLECDPSELEVGPEQIVDMRFRPRAEEQLDRRRRGEPLTHTLVKLPQQSRRLARVMGPVSGFLVDG